MQRGCSCACDDAATSTPGGGCHDAAASAPDGGSSLQDQTVRSVADADTLIEVAQRRVVNDVGSVVSKTVTLQQLLDLDTSAVPDSDAKLAGYKGCGVRELLGDATSGSGVVVAADGMTTEPIAWEHLQRSILLHSDAQGEPLQAGGPLRLWIPPEAGLVCTNGGNLTSVKDVKSLTLTVPVAVEVAHRRIVGGVASCDSKTTMLEQLLDLDTSAVPDSDAKFSGYRGCGVKALLGDAASGTGVVVAGDGMTTEPIALEHLQRSILMHSDAQGEPLQTGGPLRMWIPPEAGLVCHMGNNISVKDVRSLTLTVTDS